jgi:DNA repair exonuclease SbcCD ATPase subunit
MSADTLASSSLNAFGLAGQVQPEEIFVLTSSQLEALISRAVARAQAPLLERLEATETRLDALEERRVRPREGGEEPATTTIEPTSQPGAQGRHVLQARIVSLEDENRGLKAALSNLEELRPWLEAISKKINRLESRPEKESPKAEEHIEELYQIMRKNMLPSLSFANAAKFLGIGKGRVKQLKPQIAKDGRFDILHSAGHKQKLIIALRRHGAKTG